MKRKNNFRSEESKEIFNFLKIIILLVIVIALIYVFTKACVADKNKEEAKADDKSSEVSINYNDITIGMLLSKLDDSYYVMAYDSKATDSGYYGVLLDNYRNKENGLPIYFADLNSIFNKDFYSEKISNPNAKTIDELKILKKATGGDSLFCEFKGENGFEFVYDGLLWFCMNKLPRFGGDNGEWVYNRIMQIQCDNKIPTNEQDKYLLDKIYEERNGIVYQAIQALLQVIANGYEFIQPKTIIDARKSYQEENSTVHSFYKECMTERPNGRICDNCTTQRVFEVYKAWCGDNNHGYAKTAREFRNEISSILGGKFEEVTTKRNGSTFYKVVTLSLEAKTIYIKQYGYDNTN